MKNSVWLLILVMFGGMASAQKGHISEQERTFLLSYLDETETYLIQMLNDVPPELWNKTAGDGKWSIAGCTEHILTSEAGIIQKNYAQIQTGETQPEQTSGVQEDEQILLWVNDRIHKRVKTSENLEPTGKWKNKEEFIRAFKASRSGLRAYLTEVNAPLRHYFTSSPFGEIDLYQMYLVALAHGSRHTQQIEEIKYEMGLTTLSFAFGARAKVNCPVSAREEVQKLFGEVLHRRIDSSAQVDKVFFSEDGFVAFFYTSEQNSLSAEEHELGLWLELGVPDYQFQSVKQRLKAFGVSELEEHSSEDHFYFHAPGGMVFRLTAQKS